MAAGRRAQVEIPVARLVTQTMVALPVIVVHGKHEGPRLWLSAALHGDELNGIEIIDRVLDGLDPKALAGTVVAVPIVNVFGFLQQSRYLPDRRDLNRVFPGSSKGSLASQLARLFLSEVVERCTHGIDFHTGSNLRVNHPQVRANMGDPATARMARAFAPEFVINAPTRAGSLRESADRRGIPNLIYEGGEPQRFSRGAITAGVGGTLRVMKALGMVAEAPLAGTSHEVSHTQWLRAGRAGILSLAVRRGEHVMPGQVIAQIREPLGKRKGRILAGDEGYVIGHTTNPLVNRGDAVVNLAMLPKDAPPAPR